MILSWGGPPEWAWRSRSRNVLAPVAFCQRWNSRTQVSGSPRIRRSGARVLQRELRVGGDVAELGQPILPVVAVGGHHVRAVDRVGLGARRGRPTRRASGRPRPAGRPRGPRPCRRRRDASRSPGWCWACRRSRRRSGRPGARPRRRWRRSTAAAPTAGRAADGSARPRACSACRGTRTRSPAQHRRRISMLSSNRADAVLHRDGEGAEVGGLIADAHAQDDAPLGDEVERDHVLGHVHRMVERQQDHRGADAQPRACGRPPRWPR